MRRRDLVILVTALAAALILAVGVLRSSAQETVSWVSASGRRGLRLSALPGRMYSGSWMRPTWGIPPSR